MKTINYTITLLSDSETGSGIGGQAVNDLVTRDHLNRPVIRASHIKGLLVDHLCTTTDVRGWDNSLPDACFGREGYDNQPGCFIFSDAVATDNAKTREIARTAIGALGTAKETSLRVTEAVSVGTTFSGSIRYGEKTPEAAVLAIHMSLLGLDAVGSGRNRGAGRCLVEIKGQTATPGALLKKLDPLAKNLPDITSSCPTLPANPKREPGGAYVILRLTYRAAGPVCCPENPPVLGNNVIKSGLGIPASAVLGAMISRLADVDPEMAQGAFEDARTRAWPLLPCAVDGAPDERLPMPVRVSLSHRMSKLPVEPGRHEFKDAAIDPYLWSEQSSTSPLKASDGVLLKNGEKPVLWKSADMPRVITSHTVINPVRKEGKRTLYTVDSLAPMVFQGLLSLPPEAARKLEECLKQEPEVAFGKSRTVRGGGTLTVERVKNPGDLFSGWKTNVFVVQSPIAIPDDEVVEKRRADNLLAKLVDSAKFGTLEISEKVEDLAQVTTLAQCGVRFGWNRHGIGKTTNNTPRLRAQRVILPGSVFVLKDAPPNLWELLVKGIGEGREQGYGAVLPHPGIADQPFKIDPVIKASSTSGKAARWAIKWFEEAGKDKGPSPSQIAAVAERIRLEDNGKAAYTYLEHQRTGRPARVWERWQPVHKAVIDAINESPMDARQALQTWQDLAIINRPDKRK